MNNKIILASPAVESLLQMSNSDNLWTNEIVDSRERANQANVRLCLHEALSKLFASTTRADQDITEAIDARLIDPQDAVTAYQQLSNFLETEPCHKRILLYLPFELLPHRSWRHEVGTLNNAIDRFVTVYMERWYELLSVSDVRANFVDGDVLEMDLRKEPLPRVVKAAHFIPWLVQKDLISIPDVIQLIKDNPRSALQDSIVDTLPVLVDRKLLSDADMRSIIVSNHIDIAIPCKKVSAPVLVTEARAYWLKQEEKKAIVDASSNAVANGIVNGRIMIKNIFALTEEDEIKQLAGIYGTRKVIERLALRNKDIAIKTYNECEPSWLTLWRNGSLGVQDALWCSWSRLFHLKLLSADRLKQFGVRFVTLEESFEEKKEIIVDEAKLLVPVIETIKENRELIRFLYPVFILFGSRIKGYGANTADLDIAMFVKPDVSPKERVRLRQLLSQLLSNDKIKGKVVEFWLKEEDGLLKVIDFPELDTAQAESSWVHVLFEGALFGEKDAIKELYQKLLSRYLYFKNRKTTTDDERRIWFEEMERDTLQYRLLHRGYARYYPHCGGINTEHSDRIDGHSIFYDSGYRRLATKLFITKVFIPQI